MRTRRITPFFLRVSPLSVQYIRLYPSIKAQSCSNVVASHYKDVWDSSYSTVPVQPSPVLSTQIDPCAPVFTTHVLRSPYHGP